MATRSSQSSRCSVKAARTGAIALAVATTPLLATTLVTRPSLAAPAPAPLPATSSSPDATPAASALRVQWDERWARFRWWEYAATPVLGAASIYLHYIAPLPAQAKWQGDNAVDAAFRRWLLVDTRPGRERAGDVGDVFWLGGTAVPFAVDLPVLLFAHRQPRLAWQILMMDLEANAVAGFINNLFFYTVGRGRPSVAACAADPNYDALCGGSGNHASMPSGHVLGVATGTGLVCVHRRHLPIFDSLFDSAVADASACGVMLVATAITGVTRVMADRHYTTDVLAGAAIGLASGYGLPWLLHYRGDGRPTPSPALTFVPIAGPTTVGLGVAGSL